MKLIKLLLYLKRYIHCKIDPIGYVKSIGVTLGKNVSFYGINPDTFGSEPWLITIGDNCFIAKEVRFINHDGGITILRKEVPDLELTAPITIGNDVYLGLRTMILPGTTIGNRCVIGAGSIVKGVIPTNSVAAGVPARVIKTVDEYLEKAKQNSLKCGHLNAKDKENELKRIFGKTNEK